MIRRNPHFADKSGVTVFLPERAISARDESRNAVRRPITFWLFVSFCFFTAGLGRLAYIIRPFDSDGAMFIYMGRVISEGGRFCHDLCDNKFPTVGLMTSAAWRLFGPVWCQYVLLETALSLTMAWLLARSVARHFGPHAAVPTLLYAIVYLNMTFVVFGGFQLETLQAFFAVLAAGAALELFDGGDWRDAFVVGLAGGCATAMILFAVRAKQPLKLSTHLLALTAGLALPAAVTLIYLVRADNLRDMPGLWHQIATYARNSSWDWWDALKPVTVAIMGGFPLFVRFVIFRHAPDRILVRFNRAAVAFVLLWLTAEMAGVIAQRRMYAYHFMVLIPPLALLYGMLPRRDRLAPMVAALIPMGLFSIYGTALLIQYEYRGVYRLDVSDYLATRTEPTDTVWRDDAARLLLETGLHSGSRYPLTFLFANYDQAPLEYGAIILQDFARTKPKYIMLPSRFEKVMAHQGHEILELNRFPIRRENYFKAWHDIRAYVLSHYELETHLEADDVYRRRN
jgi:uncharacterized membrane protein YjjP (DUF1212 family)